jgi:hypothetical protein
MAGKKKAGAGAGAAVVGGDMVISGGLLEPCLLLDGVSMPPQQVTLAASESSSHSCSGDSPSLDGELEREHSSPVSPGPSVSGTTAAEDRAFWERVDALRDATSVQEIKVDGAGWTEIARDIALPGMGWVSVTGVGSATFEVACVGPMMAYDRPPLVTQFDRRTVTAFHG